ncbi:MAG: 6-phosphogluconolactonase [Hyphomicrobiales bacterium]
MRMIITRDSEELARRGAEFVAEVARGAIAARGRALLAFSGGSTPGAMLRALSSVALDWSAVHVFQVDERIVPAGSPDRNFAGLKSDLLDRVPIPPQNVHPIPVEEAQPQLAADRYEVLLARLAGADTRLDFIHLGLGEDGHTASLVPGDGALGITQRHVAVTAPYHGFRRVTLTFAALNAARARLFLVSGADKAVMLVRLAGADRTIPAGLIDRENTAVLSDAAAARLLPEATGGGYATGT